MESEKRHELRSVNEYESWGFDTFDAPDNTDPLGDLGSLFDDNDLFASDDSSSFQLAQATRGVNVDTTIDNSIEGYQDWNMNKLPEVKDLQPVYHEEDDDDQSNQSLKTLKTGKGASYLRLDNFNNRVAPSLRISDERMDGNDWSASMTDGRNDGPGIAGAKGFNLGWSDHFTGPQLLYYSDQ